MTRKKASFSSPWQADQLFDSGNRYWQRSVLWRALSRFLGCLPWVKWKSIKGHSQVLWSASYWRYVNFAAPEGLFFHSVYSLLWRPVLACLIPGCFGAYTEAPVQKGMADSFLMCTARILAGPTAAVQFPKDRTSGRAKPPNRQKKSPEMDKLSHYCNSCWLLKI